jgi:hypothetical protein
MPAMKTSKEPWKLTQGLWKNKMNMETCRFMQHVGIANDITSNRKDLQQLEIYEAQETLGNHIAPDGSTDA